MVPGRSGPQCRERLVTRVLQPQNKEGCLRQNFVVSYILSHGVGSLPLVNNFKIVCLLHRFPVDLSHYFLSPHLFTKTKSIIVGGYERRGLKGTVRV